MTEVDTAGRLLRLQQMMRRRFDQPVVGDPALVMLLELLIAGHEGRGLSGPGLTDAAGLPPATGQRYIGLLEQQGLIGKRADQRENEEGELGLTAQGDERVGQLLRDWR